MYAASAGSIEFSSSDLYAGNRALDNIKAKWSQGLKLLKRDVELSAEYDRGAKSDFLKCASLSGSCNKIKYELTTSFDDSPTDVTLETTTGDGTTFEVEGNVDGLKAQVTKVTATRAMKLRDTDCDVEISHEPQAAASKVKLSTVLGSGVTAIGQFASSVRARRPRPILGLKRSTITRSAHSNDPPRAPPVACLSWFGRARLAGRLV